MKELFEKLLADYDRLERQLSDPATLADPDRLRRLGKAHADLQAPVNMYREYLRALEERRANQELLDEADEELRELIAEETRKLDARIADLEAKLRRAMTPKDPDADKNAIVEIRAGTGGEEAALFAHDLYNMYLKYAEKKGWNTETMSLSEAEMGGIKEAVFVVEAPGAYERLKHEGGVHRVQRVPVTESSGRIHTSAATVAVLPEAEQVEVNIDPDDLEIRYALSGGPGGQSVQKNATAIRIRHVPTGVTVFCQDERSQRQNREKAMRHLRSILYQMEKEKQDAEIASGRRAQVKSGDRSEKIRTYNFPQSRVTDHRINYTTHNLSGVLNGDLDDLLDALQRADEQTRAAQGATSDGTTTKP
ncbi:MAG: peptide chain release factor 1 [Armatimonadota bacterium]